ncbi:MAG: ATP synthase subunit I [Nitrosomonadales bacterium]|jgi:ATP synthase protein I|nr:ATP synthase subunit I [Nitrosomonadales bacterium]MBT6603298.1 ATP synthase subunit I [Nitrosomonadales bacterium]MBT7120286.1 ATP synthase subunit I [Nitrosomonadales bacterium]MBT7482464.1 ATP synthase subunit I [Nitrosomonadales bacterium]
MLKKLIIAILIIALSLFFLLNLESAISVILGALCVILGIIFSVPIAYRKKDNNASKIVVDALKAEIVKIIIVVILLWLVFKFYAELVPLALIFGLAIAAIFSGLALSKNR